MLTFEKLLANQTAIPYTSGSKHGSATMQNSVLPIPTFRVLSRIFAIGGMCFCNWWCSVILIFVNFFNFVLYFTNDVHSCSLNAS